jgi:hypothetical protein
MRNLLFASLFLPLVAFAQTTTTAPAQTGVFIPAMSENATLPPPAPAEAPYNPWKLSYFGEYQGPALNNIDISKTQYPGKAAVPTEFDHYLKFGYAVSKYVVLGTQFRAFNSTDTTSANQFGFYDQRFYVQWNHMIETSDIDLTGKFTAQVPTTSASRNAGEIIAFKVEAYVVFKTSCCSLIFSMIRFRPADKPIYTLEFFRILRWISFRMCSF